jgi:hypothetical protein
MLTTDLIAGAGKTIISYIVECAGKAMGLEEGGQKFGKDVLRVELTGPKLPYLTVVDLPGLFHSCGPDQTEEDADYVARLVLSYMSRPQTMILATISAKSDLAAQIVTKYARQVDPDGHRTLGIITKPDTT